MKYLIAALLLIASCVTAAAQGCGPANPNCIVPTAPVGTSNNQAASTAFVQNQISGSNLVSGPNSSVVGDVALFNNITGNLIKDAGGGAPNVPQPHPASGNLLCPSGFNGTAATPNHVLTWADQTQCWTNDVQQWTSFDPSALLAIALSGTPNTGDVETITFHYAATTATIQYTTKVSDTATIVAGCLVDATASGCPGAGNVGIKQAGVGLYNNVAGAQGQILYVTTTGATIDIDWNSAVSMYLSNSSTGNRISFAYTGTNGANTCSSGTPCIAGLDNNPVQQIERCATTGSSPPCVVPAPGSQIWAQDFVGASSTGNADTTYGQIVMAIANSTAGSILGKMEFINKNHNGSDGLYISGGLCTINFSCQGIDSFSTGFYQSANGSANAGYYLSNNSGVADASLQEGSGGGAFFNMGAANSFFVRDHTSNPLVEVTGVGTAGIGLIYTGASTFPASSLVSLVPVQGGSAANSQLTLVSTSNGAPSGDQVNLEASNVYVLNAAGLGGAILNVGVSGNGNNALKISGATSGTVALNVPAAASGVLTLPAATDQLVGRATADTLTNKTYDTGGTGNVLKFNGTQIASIGTGLGNSGTALTSNSQTIEKFAPGQLAAVVNTKGSFTKWTKAATVDNLEGSATSFTCSGNPTITFFECGTSTTCASSPTTIGTVTVTAAGTVVDGTVSNPAITAGDYTAWAVSAGTCTALDIVGSANIHSN